MPANRGFTLIEILVVILIVGIIMGVALLAYGDFGAARKALTTAEQFSSYVQLVQQRAILGSAPLSISIANNGYETMQLVEGKSWQPLPAKGIFHWRPFPGKIVVNLRILGTGHVGQRYIVLTPDGGMTPFLLTFGPAEHPQQVTLEGAADGQIILQQEKS